MPSGESYLGLNMVTIWSLGLWSWHSLVQEFLPAGNFAGRGISVAGAMSRISKYFSLPRRDIEGTNVLQRAVLYPLVQQLSGI